MDSGTVSYYVGVVEDREDPLKIGRCRVRVVGLHTEDKAILPTEDLPWALPVLPITNASVSGIGESPVGLVPGTWVMVIFRDPDQQFPIMLGTLPGIHRSQAAETAIGDTDNLVTDGGVITAPNGEPVKNPDGTDVVVGQDEYTNAFATFLGSLGLGSGLSGIIGSILGGLFGGSSSTSAKPTASIRAEPLNANDTSKPTIIPKIETEEEIKITAQPETNKATPQTLAAPIPVEPGPEKLLTKENRGDMRRGIKALLDACDKLGLTSKYAKCAVLGICGGETLWQPISEGTLYTNKERYKETFRTAYTTNPARGEKYFNWRGDPTEFFEFVYGFDNAKGREVGSRFPGDGGKYYGRGFIQLTGKANYAINEKKLAKLGFNVPLLANPDLLIGNYELSALVTVLFFLQNVQDVPQDSPNYFETALKRVGKAVGDSYIKKRKMYEYFLGQGVIQSSTNKSMSTENRIPSAAENQYLSPQRQATLSEDRPTVTTVGFQDPTGKYPLRNLMDEPSTNRLSRGVFKDTALSAKDQARTRGIKYPNSGGQGIAWEQPLAPWGGEYPYSKVYETESGHLQIFDDTPGHETISLTHRMGTFIDIDSNGTQVNKIVGDGYTIIDRNGFIYVGGACTVNIDGDAQISISGSADLDVSGTCNANIHGNLNLGVATDLECVIGGMLTLSVGGDVNATIGGKFNLGSGGISLKTPSLISTVDVTVGPASDPILPLLPIPEEQASMGRSFEVLQAPVRPSPVVYIPPEMEADNARAVADFIANPDRYTSPEAEAAGVNPVRGPEPKIPETSSQISGGKPTDIQAFLARQLELAKEGYWSERAMSSKKLADSNPAIVAMWKDLGLASVCSSDQVPWCAVFVNWVLKQCNYRYVSTATAFAIHNNPEKWKATKVTGDVLPGDIIVWTYSHVSFVYDVRPDGKFNCVGGNQGGNNPKNNNPTGGLVTINYSSYTSSSNGSIKAIYRPSKA